MPNREAHRDRPRWAWESPPAKSTAETASPKRRFELDYSAGPVRDSVCPAAAVTFRVGSLAGSYTAAEATCFASPPVVCRASLLAAGTTAEKIHARAPCRCPRAPIPAGLRRAPAPNRPAAPVALCGQVLRPDPTGRPPRLRATGGPVPRMRLGAGVIRAGIARPRRASPPAAPRSGGIWPDRITAIRESRSCGFISMRLYDTCCDAATLARRSASSNSPYSNNASACSIKFRA